MDQQVKSYRRFLTPRVIGTTAVLMALIGAGAAAVSRADTGGEPEADRNVIVQPVETTVLQLASDLQQSRTYTGIVTAKRSADLGFERAARLKTIHFDDGDVVAAGQPIATLETRRLRSKRRETVARHQAAIALLAELTAGPREETIEAARASG